MSANKMLRPTSVGTGEIDSPHTVQFYSDDTFIIDALSRFIGGALASGDAAVVIATEAHRQALAQRLSERGLDVTVSSKQRRYIELDAAETLSKFMVDGWPDERLFADVIGAVIEEARLAVGGKDRHVAAFGEMVALLCEQGSAEAAIRIEQLWNDLSQKHRFYLRCAYSMSTFGNSEDADTLLRICNEHTHVIPGEHYARLTQNEERDRHVTGLQQKAAALETEIESRKRAERAEKVLSAIVESSDDAIASKDLNGVVMSWNAAAERMFGYKAEEIVGRSILLIIPPELHKDEDFILSKIRRGERIDHFETVRVAKSGRRIHVSLTVSPVKNGGGKIIGVAKIARDITERIRSEDALRRAEKLAVTGRLAAAIAHEINNPMQALSNVLALLAYRSSLDANTRQLVSMAESELGRMAHISRQMLSFYRESSTPVSLNITEILEDVLELLNLRMRSNRINVIRRYEFTGEISGFPAELRQLFANLLTNAVETIGENGQIKVHVSHAHDLTGSNKGGARIVIADNGPGISRENREHIFEPFFTTKGEKGTGLGLWVVKGIVAKHGGSIRMRSSIRPGQSGTVFSIFLPTESCQVIPTLPADRIESAA
jgi:PAS domain S-box-containing protein